MFGVPGYKSVSLAYCAWCLVSLCLALPSNWDQEMRDYILDIHNDYRRNEGACQMNKLEYDMDLERQAKQWAENCVFKHENIDGRGENLAWDSNHAPEKDLIKGSAKRWFEEKYIYYYGAQRACGASCHYTQLVWDVTERVGCWTSRCPQLLYAYSDAWYLVCFYSPMGNWVGEKPYEKTCDSPCRKGQTEESGLCVGKAIEDCQDKDDSCELWARNNDCVLNKKWMSKNCRKSCGICKHEEGAEGGDEEGGDEEERKEGEEEGASQKVGWSQDARDYVLDIHNEYRRHEGACQMNKLEYDMDLEGQAKQWAQNCVFKHENKDGRGENLAWDSNHAPERELIKASAQRWFDEKGMYVYGHQDHCASSCHYTQLVWANTEKVGCYTHRCPNLQYAYTDAWYFVCFYTPMGNWVGEKPYETHCDSPCRPGQTEEGGLCVGTPEEGSTESGDGSSNEPCEDGNDSCGLWARNNDCVLNPSWMLKNCRKSCKVCTAEDDVDGDDNDDASKGESCEDNNASCGMWARNNDCELNPSWMLKNCQKSCKVCTPKGGDEQEEGKGGEEDDENNEASDGGENNGEDKDEGHEVEKQEGKDKGEGCEGNCIDDNESCQQWALDHQCRVNPNYMLVHCKKSCGVC